MKKITTAPVSQLSKLQKVALGTIFNATQMEALEQVLNATPNPEVAIELLLGVYEQPKINEIPAEFNINHQNIEFVSYDKFKDEVTYRYQYASTKYHWFAKEVKEFTVANSVAEGSYSVDAVAQYNKTFDYGLSLDEFKKMFICKCIVTCVDEKVQTNSISLSHWNGDK